MSANPIEHDVKPVDRSNGAGLPIGSTDPAVGDGAMNSIALWFACLVATLGGFLFGYDWVVIGGAKPFYEACFGITQPSEQAWAMSSALVGCLAGALSAGVLSERLGRKRALLISAAVFAASALGTGMAQSVTEFVMWRVAGGVAIGMASALSPIYIAEVAPAARRGQLVCLNELTIVLGILGAQVVNWLIAGPIDPNATPLDLKDSWNGLIGWRRMFEAGFVPAAVFLVGLLFIPESPRWLAKRGEWQRAQDVLASLGGVTYAQRLIVDLRKDLKASAENQPRASLREPRIKRALLVGVVLAVLQQWCGINVIFNYAQEVFSAAGYSLSSMLFNIVITGITMVVFTFVAIATVENLGRRWLMLLGCGSLALLYVALGFAYWTHQSGWPMLLLVVGAIAVFAMTLGPITWVVLSEIFPTEVRGTSMAICTAALWSACFVLTYTFPLLNAAIGTAGTFWFYAAICIAGLVFVARYLPETKQRSLEEIQHLWRA